MPKMIDDPTISLWRLYALRGVYALIGIAMGAQVWPRILTHSGDWSLTAGVERSMLGALTLLCFVGLRHPLRMLPLLFWEAAWKTIWLIAVALPAWRAGALQGDLAETAFACGMVVVVYAGIPWDYVARRYVVGAGDRWRPLRAATAS